ncbi:hypothetical protein QTG56_26080 (plasmid) [Rossellomorea sp. AcN35-11]|nr:hypothetical protein [Rossellomorea aquimaris]WJV32086.1 hypothetical protein QTG56_26080 [Rossellomorea sp. AcN35-11]
MTTKDKGIKDLKLTCGCGVTHRPELKEINSYRDGIYCQCGRKFIILEIGAEKPSVKGRKLTLV